MPATGDLAGDPRRSRRREPLRAAPDPDATGRGRKPVTDRRAMLAVLLLVLVAAATVLMAASGDEPDDDDGGWFAYRPVDVTARTETSAPRVEAAAATPNAPPTADLGDAPIVPGGTLDAIVGADGVPSTGGYTDLIRSYFGPLTVEAIVIVQCESGFDPDAVGTNTNGTQDHGLFQINDVHMRTFEAVIGHPWTSVYDPQLNTAFAAWLHDHAGGWGPWRCNRNLEAFQAEAGD